MKAAQSNTRIIGINFGIFLVYQTLFILVIQQSSGYNALGPWIWSGITIGIHTLILFIKSIQLYIKKEKDRGGVYMLTALLIGIIGFSACSML